MVDGIAEWWPVLPIPYIPCMTWSYHDTWMVGFYDEARLYRGTHGPMDGLSNNNWATNKNPRTFRYTGCLIGIPIMFYHQLTVEYNPLIYTLHNMVFFVGQFFFVRLSLGHLMFHPAESPFTTRIRNLPWHSQNQVAPMGAAAWHKRSIMNFGGYPK